MTRPAETRSGSASPPGWTAPRHVPSTEGATKRRNDQLEVVAPRPHVYLTLTKIGFE
jgi:hypothetical protein